MQLTVLHLEEQLDTTLRDPKELLSLSAGPKKWYSVSLEMVVVEVEVWF